MQIANSVLSVQKTGFVNTKHYDYCEIYIKGMFCGTKPVHRAYYPELFHKKMLPCKKLLRSPLVKWVEEDLQEGK